MQLNLTFAEVIVLSIFSGKKEKKYRIRKPNITGEKGIVDDVVIAGEKDYF